MLTWLTAPFICLMPVSVRPAVLLRVSNAVFVVPTLLFKSAKWVRISFKISFKSVRDLFPVLIAVALLLTALERVEKSPPIEVTSLPTF